jgi:hypothetical protein
MRKGQNGWDGQIQNGFSFWILKSIWGLRTGAFGKNQKYKTAQTGRRVFSNMVSLIEQDCSIMNCRITHFEKF